MEKIFSTLIKTFKTSYETIEKELLTIIEKIAYINEEVFSSEPLKSFYGKDNINNIRLLVFSIIFSIVIFKISKNIFCMYRESYLNYIPQIAIKGVLAIIIATNSMYILKEIINLNFLFTTTIESLLSEIINDEISFESLAKTFDSVEHFLKDRFKINFKDSTKVISCILLSALLIIFSIRYVNIVLFLILFPFLVLFLLFNDNYIVKKFFIHLGILLIIQNINKVILFIPLVCKNEELYEVILIGSLFVLYKINKSIINIGDIWKK